MTDFGLVSGEGRYMPHLREFFYWLALQHIFFAFPKFALDLVRTEGSPETLFNGDRSRLRKHFGGRDALFDHYKNFDDWFGIEKELETIERAEIRLIHFGGEGYPALLEKIFDPPLMLFARGKDHSLLNGPAVAIVGSRKASEHGKHIAAEMAGSLSNEGYVVVSGMAFGIDAAAHRGALSGSTGTVAVFGCGIDVIYPERHLDLSRKIMETGLLLSEFPLGLIPQPQNFPQRNRIISGLAVATVIVEATEKSGSLITARFALEQGREVLACPGPAAVNFARGTNALIRDGAALVECGKDVADILSAHVPEGLLRKKTGLFEIDVDKDSPLLKILAENKAVTVDDIIMISHLGAHEVLENLTRLTVEGRVEEMPGRRFRLKDSLKLTEK